MWCGSNEWGHHVILLMWASPDISVKQLWLKTDMKISLTQMKAIQMNVIMMMPNYLIMS